MSMSKKLALLFTLFLELISCSKLGQVENEMNSMLDSCKVLPFASSLYKEFNINSSKDMIIEYTYRIPERKYVSNCYIDTLWGSDMYLQSSALEHNQKASTAFLKASYEKELNYMFICSVLLDSTVHDQIIAPQKKRLIITKNNDHSFGCHTSELTDEENKLR